MAVQLNKLVSAVAAVGLAASLMISGTALASARRASAPSADVATLVAKIQSAINAAQASFPSDKDCNLARAPFRQRDSCSGQEAAIQSAINSAIAASGFDAVTAEAALSTFSSNPSSPTGEAVSAVLRTVTAQARQESAQAGSTGGSGSSGGGGGGGGGYIIGH
jgi:hypothetical protein